MAVVKKGNLLGLFSGFRQRDTVFVFTDGERWQQDEHQYVDHYAHRPTATIQQEGSACYLSVEGVDGRVRVRRA